MRVTCVPLCWGVLQWASELRTLRPDRTFTKDSSAYSTILTANNRRFGQPASSNRNDTVGVESRDVTTSLERADENGAALSLAPPSKYPSLLVLYVIILLIIILIMTLYDITQGRLCCLMISELSKANLVVELDLQFLTALPRLRLGSSLGSAVKNSHELI